MSKFQDVNFQARNKAFQKCQGIFHQANFWSISSYASISSFLHSTEVSGNVGFSTYGLGGHNSSSNSEMEMLEMIFSPKKWSTLEKSWTAKFGLCWLSPLNLCFRKAFINGQWWFFVSSQLLDSWVGLSSCIKRIRGFYRGRYVKKEGRPCNFDDGNCCKFRRVKSPNQKNDVRKGSFHLFPAEKPFCWPQLVDGGGWLI